MSLSSSSNGSSSPTPSYPLISRAELQIIRQLSFGSYGSIFEGIWNRSEKDVKKVALKKVFMLEKEAEILSQVRHRNIVQFYGVSYSNPDFFIVVEFAENGSLYDRLHTAENLIDFEQVLIWAVQIAQGVAYLHYDAPVAIIHRDLKSKNVVLTRHNICKLCDFGTSKNLTNSFTAPTWGGTVAWMSPEIIVQSNRITTAADVWSYGVLLWEMISREVPFDGLAEFRIFSMVVQQGATPVIPENCPSALSSIMRGCWKIEPSERLDMKQIMLLLDAMLTNSDLSTQCQIFLSEKAAWKKEIEDQKRELEAIKIDYSKRLQELNEREEAVKSREHMLRSSYAVSLHDDVTAWDESHVCQWIRDVSPNFLCSGSLEHLSGLITNNKITGKRLLNMSPKDLETLGICSAGIRKNFYGEIMKLKKLYQRAVNFPPLVVAHHVNDLKNANSPLPMVSSKILISVVLYSRECLLNGIRSYRFKVVIDTDWENVVTAFNLPSSQSFVKDINVKFRSNEDDFKQEFHTASLPFVMPDWIFPVHHKTVYAVQCGIGYKDCVTHPRSTSFDLVIRDYTKTQDIYLTKAKLVINVSRITTSIVDTTIAQKSAKLERSVSDQTGKENGAWRSLHLSEGYSHIKKDKSVESLSSKTVRSKPKCKIDEKVIMQHSMENSFPTLAVKDKVIHTDAANSNEIYDPLSNDSILLGDRKEFHRRRRFYSKKQLQKENGSNRKSFS